MQQAASDIPIHHSPSLRVPANDSDGMFNFREEFLRESGIDFRIKTNGLSELFRCLGMKTIWTHPCILARARAMTSSPGRILETPEETSSRLRWIS